MNQKLQNNFKKVRNLSYNEKLEQKPRNKVYIKQKQ